MSFDYKGVLIPVKLDTREMLRAIKQRRTYDEVISDLIAIADLQGYTASKRNDE